MSPEDFGLTIFPTRDRISSIERGRERGEGEGERQNLMAEGNAAGREGGRGREREGGRGRKRERLREGERER